VSEFRLRRLGVVMEPEPGNPLEADGVLNPAAARGPDGQLYLFPRLTARGNYSRIGIARVRFNEAGDPTGVERLGMALEPEADYERRPDGSGGCEDPRITFVEPLQRYLMTYTAWSSHGPRIAMAVSEDIIHWKRLGLATFASCDGIEFGNVDDKDASSPASREVDIDRESIWISYCQMTLDHRPFHAGQFTFHHRLASPVSPWERLKIGGGTPPILTRHGWLIIYHGVSEIDGPDTDSHMLCYSAGVMIFSKEHPLVIKYRSAEPVLTPELPEERHGIVANVVFPTGIDKRDDLGTPDRFDVYYGMADNRIGAARFDLPDHLPAGADADSPKAKV